MDDRIAAGYERDRDFVFEALGDERILATDWRDAVHDAALEIDRIVQRNAHPDDAMHARLAMGALVNLWLTLEEAEALYEGGVGQWRP